MKDVLLGMATCTPSHWIRRAVSPSLVNLIEVTCQQPRGVFLEGGVTRREGWFSNSFTDRKEGAGEGAVPCTGTWVRAPL